MCVLLTSLCTVRQYVHAHVVFILTLALETVLLINGMLTPYAQYTVNLLLFEISQVSYSKHLIASLAILGAQGLLVLAHFYVAGVDQYIQMTVYISACAFQLIIYASNGS